MRSLAIKRRRVEDRKGASTQQLLHADQSTEASVLGKDTCGHPGFVSGMCFVCGRKVDRDNCSAKYHQLNYIFKDFMLAKDEIARLRDKGSLGLLRDKKLHLVLDLDHTVLNSTDLEDITPDEEYLKSQIDSLQDISNGKLFMLDSLDRMTKLRPFVRPFLEEASKLFDMYIYTRGTRGYALEMARLLDPGERYFGSKVIAREDCTRSHQKGLDVVLAKESDVLILDDQEWVWPEHKENLILMERYNYFASSCWRFGPDFKSLSELKTDEPENDGPLASALDVLKRIRSMYFSDLEPAGANLAERDVREVLKTLWKSCALDTGY